MKKILGMMLASGLVLSTAVAAVANPKVNFGGEGIFGYDFAKDAYNEDDGGANFGKLEVKAETEIVPNITLYGEIRTDDLSKGNYFCDQCWAYLKFAPVNVKVGYYEFGFGNSKDILDAAWGDFKSNVGIQLDTMIAGVVTTKLYFPTRQGKSDSDKEEEPLAGDCEDNAFGVSFDYAAEKYGVGAMYGQTEWGWHSRYVETAWNDEDEPTAWASKYNDATIYAVNAYYKPSKDLKTYVEYSTSNRKASDYWKENEPDVAKDADDTDIIIGAVYTPQKLPIEARLEYDLNDKAPESEKSFNPWGVRLAYKLNPTTKIEINRFEKSTAESDRESSIKLSVAF